MNDSTAIGANKALLAILLTLDILEVPLNPDEQAALKKAGQRLAMNPKKWESEIKRLLDSFAANSSFTASYLDIRKQLEDIDGDIPVELLPNEDELKQVLPGDRKPVKRVYFEGTADKKSNEILNLAINVLRTPEPDITSKKLSLFQRISKLF